MLGRCNFRLSGGATRWVCGVRGARATLDHHYTSVEKHVTPGACAHHGRGVDSVRSSRCPCGRGIRWRSVECELSSGPAPCFALQARQPTNEVAVRSVEIPRNMLRCGVVHNKLSLSLSESLSTLCGRTMCSYVHSVELMCFELEARESS